MKASVFPRTLTFLTLFFFTLAGAALAQQFQDVSTEAGLVRTMSRAWGNPIWGDINNDGYLDLIVPIHELDAENGNPGPFVYINNKDGTFTDARATAGLVRGSPDSIDWQGFAMADYDGDGNLDLYIAEPPFQGEGDVIINISQVPKRDLLYKGNGDGTFTYASDIAGIAIDRNFGECAFFVDYDNDGLLDIFVKNMSTGDEASVNVLYKNNGDGTFTQVPDAAGLAEATEGNSEGTLCSFADYDNDGYMDVVFAGGATAEALYHNEGDGTFVEVTNAAGLSPRTDAEGLAWGDYDNDGYLDLYVSRGKQVGSANYNNTLYHNLGNGTFADVTHAAGVNDGTNTWAAVWGDYDNDGYLDLFVCRPGTTALGPGNANLLYHNNGDGTFTDQAAAEGVAMETDKDTESHKVASWGDYNNDGFLDLVVQDGIGPTLLTGEAAQGLHYLFKNLGNSNHFIKIKLKGVQSNLDGLGARATVIYDGGQAFRENTGGGGGDFASQGSEPLHFGIGAAESATVKVVWPSGTIDVLPSVDANSSITVTEGSSPPPVQAQNISTRLDVQTGAEVGIGGFIITGTGPKNVLVRGLGPSLASQGVEGVLANPVLELHKPDGKVVINDDWRDDQQNDISATGLAPTDDSEAAILASLDAGAYTAILSGSNGGTGNGLVEVYDLDQGISSELANVSTRGFVGTGDNVLIGGVIVGPTGAPSADLILRAIGPTLGNMGVDGSLQDPTLELHDSQGTVVASDDNWQDDPTQAAAITAAGLAPEDPHESGIQFTAPTGAYTAIVAGKNATTGVALVEVYNVKSAPTEQ